MHAFYGNILFHGLRTTLSYSFRNFSMSQPYPKVQLSSSVFPKALNTSSSLGLLSPVQVADVPRKIRNFFFTINYMYICTCNLQVPSRMQKSFDKLLGKDRSCRSEVKVTINMKVIPCIPACTRVYMYMCRHVLVHGNTALVFNITCIPQSCA